MTKRKRTILDDAEQMRMEAQIADLRTVKRQQAHEISSLRSELGRALDIGDDLRDLAQSMPPPAPWTPPPHSRGKPRIALVALVSDLQTGEVVSVSETESWGRYNWAIERMRIARYAEEILRYVEVQRGGYDIRDCYVFVLGDLISGDIHEELARTNEFPPPVQATQAGRLLSAFLHALSGHFRHVQVEMVGGSNHSRLTKRYQFKQGALNSFDYVVHEYARGMLRGAENVTMRHHPGRTARIMAEGWAFMLGHGDEVMSWAGFPWYGIIRRNWRDASAHMRRMMEQLRKKQPVEAGFDYAVGAHWHTPVVGPNCEFVVNGSVTGTTELDHAMGRSAGPQQMTMLLSPHHGLFGFIPWHLESEEELEHVHDRWEAGSDDEAKVLQIAG